MAYSTGDLILDDHYNQFADTDINGIWGAGTGDSGYGQTATTLATVADGVTVSATQWTNLLNRISAIAAHQSSSITSITNPSASDTISVLGALSSNISTVQSNRLNTAGFGTPISTTISTTATWYTSRTQRARLTFAGGDEARYFFNTGGKVGVSFARSGGTSSSKNTEWTNLCTASATYEMFAQTGGKTGGSGSPGTNLTTTGYYDLTNSYGTKTTMFQQFEDTGPYTANYIIVYMSMNAADGDARGNNGTQLDIEVVYVDGAADQISYNLAADNILDQVDGTLTTTFSATPPATTYVSNSWGTPSWSTITNSGS